MSASCERAIVLAGDLHARPAGALAVAAGRFASAVSVTAGGHTADAKSVLGVMGLGATSGQNVTVAAAGPDAREAVAALIAILSEGDMYWPRLRGLLADGKIAGPAVHDARIAALCLTNGVQALWTADRDFSRFPRLRTVNPLI